jgi:hypothetical protein
MVLLWQVWRAHLFVIQWVAANGFCILCCKHLLHQPCKRRAC